MKIRTYHLLINIPRLLSSEPRSLSATKSTRSKEPTPFMESKVTKSSEKQAWGGGRSCDASAREECTHRVLSRHSLASMGAKNAVGRRPVSEAIHCSHRITISTALRSGRYAGVWL